MGHAVRLLGLAQQLRHRGVAVVLLGEIDVPWLRAEFAAEGISVMPAPHAPQDLVAMARHHELTSLVLDKYDLDPETGATARNAGLGVLAMVDGEFGAAQQADVYIDQNLGAVPHTGGPADAQALAGVEFALFRDTVLDQVAESRQFRSRSPRSAHAPRVLAVFGGTDPFGAASVVTQLMIDTDQPFDATVVVPDPGVRAELGQLRSGPHQVVRPIGPVPDLAAVASTVDVAVSAAGSTVWELLCLGVPTAAVCVVDNQYPGYALTVDRGVVVGLGLLDGLRDDGIARTRATSNLRKLFSDNAFRDDLSAQGMHLVDGRGRERIANVLLDLEQRSY